MMEAIFAIILFLVASIVGAYLVMEIMSCFETWIVEQEKVTQDKANSIGGYAVAFLALFLTGFWMMIA